MSLSQRLACFALRLLGWRCIDLPQRPSRAVVIGYPHTSNWDFPVGLLGMAALGLNARWVGKDTLFRWPFGGLMRWLGGVPVNRAAPGDFVERIADEIRRHPRFMLVIAPEGTRSLRPGWKSGFYRIARAAEVPVLVGTVDYGQRRLGLLAEIALSGDETADMNGIAASLADCRGLRPERASPIRLL
ncbi:MAG: 1-acyl-sn-glycerol-3-phosphate acyltransferase [Gammaproteobacteria bacterium]|nr:1-acyl-sn-glycerol-3-phosphate acyltransferase [Gammaproteobacteria bacterium]MBU1414667.1 1-acyl-sn-glycerol-3-phosphate acyltransferase [Gammaproteobacteria bacterium]